MTANEEHARKLEMEYKEMQCEADRAQAKKEVRAPSLQSISQRGYPSVNCFTCTSKPQRQAVQHTGTLGLHFTLTKAYRCIASAQQSHARSRPVLVTAQELWHKAQKVGESADQAGDEGYVNLGALFVTASASSLSPISAGSQSLSLLRPGHVAR